MNEQLLRTSKLVKETYGNLVEKRRDSALNNATIDEYNNQFNYKNVA